MIRLAKHAKCMTSGCKQQAVTRGLCGSCYGNARMLVSRGRTTWEELAELEMIRPSKHVKSPFLSELNRRREKRSVVGKSTEKRAKVGKKQ